MRPKKGDILVAGKVRDRREVERYRVVSEIASIHNKHFIKEKVCLALLFAVIPVLFGGFVELGLWILYALYGVHAEELEVYADEYCMLVCTGIGMILLAVVYFRLLHGLINKMFSKFGQDYKVLYMSGLTDSSALCELVYFPMAIVPALGVICYIIVIKLFELAEHEYIFSSAVVIIGLIVASLLLINKRCSRDFLRISEIEDEYDLSMVDGSYGFVTGLNVEENIALPYRMMRGKDSVEANSDISNMARDVRLDMLLRVEVDKLTPVHRTLVMMLRSYMLCGRDMKVDDSLLAGCSPADREAVNNVLNRMMNPYMDRRSVPSNVLR